MYKINKKNFVLFDGAEDWLNCHIGCEIYHLPARSIIIYLTILEKETVKQQKETQHKIYEEKKV